MPHPKTSRLIEPTPSPEGRHNDKRKKDRERRCKVHEKVHVTLMAPQCHFHTPQKIGNSPNLWPSRKPTHAQHGSEHDRPKTHTNNVRHDCKETQNTSNGNRNRFARPRIGHERERPRGQRKKTKGKCTCRRPKNSLA